MRLRFPNGAAALVLGALLATSCGPRSVAPRLYAAASLTDAVGALSGVADAPEFVASLAGTSTLARQIEAGARPGVMIAADERWADHLEGVGLVETDGRVALLANELVVIVPPGTRGPRALADLADERFARIALADPDAVPAGRYARSALSSAGAWDAVSSRVVACSDVRAAVALVARGEVDAAIVYRTDTRTGDVSVACGVPPDTHPPIVYPLLLLRGATGADRVLFAWLQGGAARTVFAEHGFTAVAR